MVELLRILTGWKRINRLTAQALLTEMRKVPDYHEDRSSVHRINRNLGFEEARNDDTIVGRYFKVYRSSREAPKICLREVRWSGSYDYGEGKYPIFHRATLDIAIVDKIVN